MAAARGGPTLTAPAIAVDVHQVQGAGAAFSAALMHSRDRGDPTLRCLEFACAAGSLWCARTADGPLPTSRDISALLLRS